jgi:hypothetical protein
MQVWRETGGWVVSVYRSVQPSRVQVVVSVSV